MPREPVENQMETKDANIDGQIRIWASAAIQELEEVDYERTRAQDTLSKILKQQILRVADAEDFPGWLDMVQSRHRSIPNARCALTDLGESWLPGSSLLRDDEALGWQVLDVAARLGGLMAQLLLLRDLATRSPGDNALLCASAYREYVLRSDDPDPQWQYEKTRYGTRFENLALEIGLRGAITLADVSLASEVLERARKTPSFPMSLTSLLWNAEALVRTADPVAEDAMRVLAGITPSPEEKENRALQRYKSLLSPIPLCRWPEGGGWIDALRKQSVGMDAVIAALEGEMKLSRAVGQRILRFRPILLLGAPGLGKTTFILRLAEALGVPGFFVTLAGSNDNMMLKGTARGWSSARPSYLVDEILRNNVANPIVCLDEIEKVSMGRNNGRVWETLISLLEPSSSRAVLDEYLLGEVDYSAVNWIATANSTEDLPGPLRSRFKIIRIGAPQPEDFERILAGILGDIARDLRTETWALPRLDPEVLAQLRSAFRCNPGSLRRLSRSVRQVLEWEARREQEQRVLQ